MHTTIAVDLANHADNQRRFIALEAKVDANTKVTESIASDTAEFLAIFKAVKGGFKVLGWLGMFAKWAGGLAAALAGVYFAFKGGPHL